MHEIKIKKMTFSNLMSYGNNVNEIDFTTGITWIKGNNGVGKSVIIEGLTYALFGKAYRNINKKDVKNNSNKSPLKIKLDFDRISGEGTVVGYSIVRTMTNSGSSKFIIYKNEVEQEKAAGITQKKLEKEILGFNQTIFENVISLNNIQTTPFIDMDAKDRRQFTESVVTLHIDKFKKENSKYLSEVNTKFNSAKSDVEKYEKDVEELKIIVEKAKKEKENYINELKGKTEILENKIKELNTSKNVCIEEKNNLTEKGIKLKEKIDKFGNIETKIYTLKMFSSNLEYINELNTKLDIKNKELYETNAELEKINKSINDLGEVDQNKLDALNKGIKEITKNVVQLSVNVKNTEDELKTIEEKAKNLKSGIPCPTCNKPSTDDDINKIKQEYRNKWKDINSKHKKYKEEFSKKSEEEKNVKKDIDELTNKKDIHTTFKTKYDSCVSNKNNLEKEINNITQDINTKKEKNNDLNISYESIEEISEQIKSLEEEIKEKEKLNNELNIIREETIKKIENNKNIDNNIKSYKDDIIEIKKQIEKKNEKDIDDSYNSAQKRLNDTKEDLNRANERIIKYSDEIEIAKYIDKMYSDDGIKRIVLGIFVPNLNNAISHNLNLFELPFSVKFKDSMEYDFQGKFGLADVYEGLSQGQKRKLNFAISIAFRDFVTSIADFKINIFFLDEVLDISTDDEALLHMITLLRTKVTEIGDIYLMTHRGSNFVEEFDYIIEVNHDGRYSSMKHLS